MRRDAEPRIVVILEAIERCSRYADALDGDGHVAEMVEDAIARNMQFIGEAVKHLPVAITDARPEIAWPQIRGFRNIPVHQHFGVDIDAVQDVIKQDQLPPNLQIFTITIPPQISVQTQEPLNNVGTRKGHQRRASQEGGPGSRSTSGK